LTYFVDADHIRLKTLDGFIDRAISSHSTPTTSATIPATKPSLVPAKHKEDRVDIPGIDGH
jgi:hypothetical protein